MVAAATVTTVVAAVVMATAAAAVVVADIATIAGNHYKMAALFVKKRAVFFVETSPSGNH